MCRLKCLNRHLGCHSDSSSSNMFFLSPNLLLISIAISHVIFKRFQRAEFSVHRKNPALFCYVGYLIRLMPNVHFLALFRLCGCLILIDERCGVLAMVTVSVRPMFVFLMLVLILFWGSSFVVVKVTLEEGLTPVAVATFRFLVAGVLFVIVLLVGKARNRSHRLLIARKDVPVFLLLALSGVTFFFIAQYTGIELAGASVAAILVTLLSPILIAVFSARLFMERLVRRQVFGVGAAAVGAFVVIAGGTLSLESNANFLLGCVILLTTPVLWTVYSLVGKQVMERYDAFLVVSYVNALGGLCLVPFSLAQGSLGQIFSMSAYEWLAVLFLAVTCSVVGYFIWFYVLNHVGAAVTSSFLFAEPVVTVLFAARFAGEQLNLLILSGGVLIFLGVWQVVRK
jgi:drug/metabolite transporter (DMT)-like permease